MAKNNDLNLKNWKELKICPHCEIELVSKMFDVDGTNLVEHNVCEKCGYGTPALV